MADGSNIEWTQATWNFITGCTKISDGCLACYIERTPPFRMTHRRFNKPGIGGTTGVVLHEDRLTLPLRWRKPRRIFVNSLADLWHDEIPTDLIARAFAVMVAAPHHSFQVLTKRHARMRSMLRSEEFWTLVSEHLGKLWNTSPPAPLRCVPEWIWLGVSVESQQWADVRVPALLDVPAMVRWLSCEPLVGAVDLSKWLYNHSPWTYTEVGVRCSCGAWMDRNERCPEQLSWCVVGGESGPGARPMQLDWARDIVKQCQETGVTPFVKQLGSRWAWLASAAWPVNAKRDPKGGNWDNWPEDLRVREFPQAATS